MDYRTPPGSKQTGQYITPVNTDPKNTADSSFFNVLNLTMKPPSNQIKEVLRKKLHTCDLLFSITFSPCPPCVYNSICL